MENNSFRELLKEHMELKGFSNKKIAEATGIPERYIEALINGEDRIILPPSPYVRGYITKLSSILEFDKDMMWRLYQSESQTATSGGFDRLPGNRFAVKTLSKKWLIGSLVGLFAAVYLSSNIYQMFSAPKIKIMVPDKESMVWQFSTIVLRGEIESANTLTINGVEVYVGKDGKFEKDYSLQPGLNTLEFSAKKFLGKEAKIVRQIMYQPDNQLNDIKEDD